MFIIPLEACTGSQERGKNYREKLNWGNITDIKFDNNENKFSLSGEQ